MAELWIANTVADLIQGDVREHLPLESIPLRGDVLGLGTTTSLDNGELTFLPNADGDTTIWKCQAGDGGIRAMRPGDGSAHFPFVCFSGDAAAVRTPVDPQALGTARGQPLQQLVAEAIRLERQRGRLCEAPVYGVRLEAQWQSLVITVASKLCMGQQRRNAAIARSEATAATTSRSIYQLLQHFRLAPLDPADPSDPIRYLGRSLHWDCCGFYDMHPELGRLTVPEAGAHLHLHGCSTDLRHGGHLHHEHEGTQLERLDRLVLYPFRDLHLLASDLGIAELAWSGSELQFRVYNRGAMDVSDVGVAVVIDDRYGSHRYLRLPWLAAGGEEHFRLPLPLAAGPHRIEVIADPQGEILETEALRVNNRQMLEVMV
jgi:hypothetical protein